MGRIFCTVQSREGTTHMTLPPSHTFQELGAGTCLSKIIPSAIEMLDKLNAFVGDESWMTKFRFATLYTTAIIQTYSFNDQAVCLKANNDGRWTESRYLTCVQAAQNQCIDAIALTGYCKPRLTPPGQHNPTRGEVLFFKHLMFRVFGENLNIADNSGMPSLWIYLCSAIASERGWSWPWQQTPKEALPAIPGRSYIAAILNVSHCYRSFKIMENIFKQMEYTLWEYLQYFMLSGMLGHPIECGDRDKRATNQQLAEIYSFFYETGKMITSAGGPKCFRMGLPELKSRNPSNLYSLRFMAKGVADKVLAVTSAARKGKMFNWADDLRGGIWVVAERYFRTLENPKDIYQFLRSGPLCANDHFRVRVEKQTSIFPGTEKRYKEQLVKQFGDELFSQIKVIRQNWQLSNRPFPRIHDTTSW